MKKNILYILFLLQCLIGGTTWAFQKIGLQNSLPFWAAGMRFIIASTLIILGLLISKKFKINKKVLVISFLYGLMYFAFPFGSVYWASVYLPSGLISVLSSSISVFVLIFAILINRTPTKNTQKVGTILCTIGIAIVFGDKLMMKGSLMEIVAMLIVLVAMIGSAFTTVIVKSKIKYLPFMTFTSLSMGFGGSFLLISSLVFEKGTRTFSGSNLISLIYLSIIASICGFCINMHILKKWHVSKATAHLFVSPIIAIYIGVIFLRESLNSNIFWGTFFVIIGVMLINIKIDKRKILVIQSEQKEKSTNEAS
ncbi:DMT family transporter [Clostridium sp. ZS2-4]|uniref:DMT family transporter n=1 Tax=Clostridium sp. ZS2-4 TaxID=2987703 RepID=UPI00227A5A09|nr:EamA family transporter [Clostridium sp. ZS2-4]MCY6355337.1 EamA family transporter [Clostridium sp. ZS2-4]